MPEMIDDVSHVNADELQAWIDQTDRKVYVVDVREPEEYVAGHIPGVPLLPMGEIPEHIDDFDKTAEYVFVCRSGRRSLEVSKFFKREGIAKVHNYEGGMLVWDKDVAYGEENIVGEFSDMHQLERKPSK